MGQEKGRHMYNPPDLPTGTLTFLFTDIENSTLLWEQDPDLMQSAMVRHDELVEGRIAEYKGLLVRPRGEGDSRFAVFTLASDAAFAAIAIQRSMYKEQWPVVSPLRVRIGLHTGEANLRDGDYYGPAVNRCARIRSAAHGGQTLLSMTTASLVEDSLPEDASLRDLGEYKIKDLQRPEQIFQLVVAGLPVNFPPLRTVEGIRTNLPSMLSSFVGRDEEIAELKKRLSESRLLTITGMGGSGKTRLALQVGTELIDHYTGGVWLVDLAPLTNPHLTVKAVADVFNIREEEGRPLLPTLVETLRQKTLLLILDNCEHLLQEVAVLSERLLSSAPRVRILATSREPLGVVGETVWQIPPLSFPETLTEEDVDSYLNYDAIRLFVNRAAAARPGFQVNEQNISSVGAISKGLEGNALAIELAAARVKMLPVEDIARRLEDCFRLLVSNSRTAHSRQQTLRALIDWSYDLLSETERILLRRLGVFKGGWTLEAAETVCSSEDLDDQQILDTLTSLVDKSLVVSDVHEDQQRYRYLEMIRQYALERLFEDGEAEEIERKHAQYYLGLAEKSRQELWGARQGLWLALLKSEHDNLRGALEWMKGDPARSGMMLQMVRSLWRFWDIHGHISEGLNWIELALETNPNGQAALRANVLRGAGYLARQQGDYVRAKALHERSLAIFREINDTLGVARELSTLGEILWIKGDPKVAVEFNQESLALHYEMGNKEGVASSLEHLGIVARDHGDYSQARDLLDESLKIQREIGDALNIASCLNNLALVDYLLCHYQQAITLFDEALSLYRQLNERWGLSETLINLGNVAKDQGDFKRAIALYNQSLTMKQELGDIHGVARGFTGLAEVAFYQGNYPLAEQLSEQTLKLYKERGIKRGMVVSTMLLAVTKIYQGDLYWAEILVKEGLALSSEIETPRSLAYAHVIYGLGEYTRGDLQAAVEHLMEALAIFRKVDDRRSIAQTLVNLARSAYRQGDQASASTYLEESLSLSRELDIRWSLAFSLEIMGLVKRSQGDLQAALPLFQESLMLSAEQANQQGIANCLGAIAGLAALNGQPAESARLFSAAANLRSSMGAKMGANDQHEYEQYLAVLRQKLDEALFNRLMLEGCNITTEQAVEHAMQVTFRPSAVVDSLSATLANHDNAPDLS
jgi:predicted ATPase/class 3 adenylate cyclase/Tfp pilus assembly protein PilF